jgi:hypothetical protein
MISQRSHATAFSMRSPVAPYTTLIQTRAKSRYRKKKEEISLRAPSSPEPSSTARFVAVIAPDQGPPARNNAAQAGVWHRAGLLDKFAPCESADRSESPQQINFFLSILMAPAGATSSINREFVSFSVLSPKT